MIAIALEPEVRKLLFTSSASFQKEENMLEHQQDIKRSFVPSSQTVLNIHYLQKSSGWFDFSSDAVEVALKS